MLDTLILSRLQFAANISFHILFPAISIGLAWFLLFFKVRFQRTGDELWMRCYRFWVKIFALTFALGVVSGITMSFQFGTNWPGFMERVGNIAGPLLGYEVLTAFFMEATFLGIMLFGIKRVPGWVHTFATGAVAFGTTLSAFWIIALNSWMHTPAGFEMRDGVAFATDWVAVIFNPSMPYRLVHVLLASVLTAAFVVSGISAYRLLRKDPKPAPRMALKVALWVAAIVTPMQILAGDMHGLNSFEHQPAKVAAIEGVWETRGEVPFVLFGIPNEETRTNDWAIEIPYATSLVLTHELDGVVKGLNDFEEHPPVAPIFWSFRIMVAVGLAMLALSWLGVWQLWRTDQVSPLTKRALVAMSFSGWVATIAGWYVTEIGRQPYLVSGVLPTREAVTSAPPEHVGITLVAYLVIYGALLIAYVSTVFHMARKSAALEAEQYQQGPGAADPSTTTISDAAGATA
ncbi:MAG: cytochrome ubiquinol oxidase subunit I [Pseudomonadota bacterium]